MSRTLAPDTFLASSCQRQAAVYAAQAWNHLAIVLEMGPNPAPYSIARAKHYQSEAAKLSKSARQLMGLEPLSR